MSSLSIVDGSSLLYLCIVFSYLPFTHNMVLLLKILIVLKKYILLVANFYILGDFI